jgi:YesN/AraC family two-component response regulator
MPPKDAYRVSGYYIQKCEEAHDASFILKYRNQALLEMAAYVRDNTAHTSGYVNQCEDYIRKHYREKIYLQDIADSLGLSPTYLSRRFSKDTGECVQDYINRIRVYHASNLLLYSDRTLSEIAFYVGFPNQSYFGKIFKKFRNMSPKAYQDRYRSAEYNPE